jgi:hypothetical protein
MANDASEAAPAPPRATELAETFAAYANAARGTASSAGCRGDGFAESLARTRAGVYDRAAELVRNVPPGEAARTMMENAMTRHVRTPPLTDFDKAGLGYIAARAWQFCAWQIDPTLEEVAPAWR